MRLPRFLQSLGVAYLAFAVACDDEVGTGGGPPTAASSVVSTASNNMTVSGGTPTGSGGAGGAGAGDGGGGAGGGGGGGPSGGDVWTSFANNPLAYEEVVDLATTSDGGVVLLLWIDGTTDLGGGPITTQSDDLAIAKYEADGTHEFTALFGGADHDIGLHLALGPSDEIFVTGVVGGEVDFGGGPENVTGLVDGFLLALDPDGKHLWSKVFGGDAATDFDRGFAVATSTAGMVVVTGSFYGTMNLGGSDLLSDGVSGFVAAFDSATGAHIYSLSYDDVLGNGVSVAVDDGGNAYLTGSFDNELTLGNLESTGYNDAFLAKLDATGALEWAKRAGGVSSDYGAAVGVDGAGNVVQVGRLVGPADFGGGSLTCIGFPDCLDLFVARFGPDGDHLSSRLIPGTQSELPYDLEVQLDGRVLIGGEFSGTIDLGSTQLVAPFAVSIPFWIALDDTNALIDGDAFQCDGPAALRGLSLAPDESIYFGGAYSGQLSVGQDVLPHSGFNTVAAFWGRAPIGP